MSVLNSILDAFSEFKPIIPSLAHKTSIPLYVICHNNELYVQQTIEQLDHLFQTIIIINNASTCESTQKYLANLSPEIKIINNSTNIHPSNLVQTMTFPEKFCLTDPDLAYPENFGEFVKRMDTLAVELQTFKIGPALYLKDWQKIYTDQYVPGATITQWESQNWRTVVAHSKFSIFSGGIDTTFAFYDKSFESAGKCARVADFAAKHLPWYPEHNNALSPNQIHNMYTVDCPFSTIGGIIRKHYIPENV